MARDDMHVLIYKALAYLYSCMRKGTAPDRAALACDGMVFGGVPEAYWAAIWAEMIERGLVKGASILWADNERSVILQNPEVTLYGVEFMQENTMMRKALDALREAKSTLPFL